MTLYDCYNIIKRFESISRFSFSTILFIIVDLFIKGQENTKRHYMYKMLLKINV